MHKSANAMVWHIYYPATTDISPVPYIAKSHQQLQAADSKTLDDGVDLVLTAEDLDELNEQGLTEENIAVIASVVNEELRSNANDDLKKADSAAGDGHSVSDKNEDNNSDFSDGSQANIVETTLKSAVVNAHTVHIQDNKLEKEDTSHLVDDNDNSDRATNAKNVSIDESNKASGNKVKHQKDADEEKQHEQKTQYEIFKQYLAKKIVNARSIIDKCVLILNLQP